MWVVRAVQIEDLDALDALVQSATRGLTSLQLNRERLLDRVEHSVFAFSRTSMSPVGEPYVLVLANDETVIAVRCWESVTPDIHCNCSGFMTVPPRSVVCSCGASFAAKAWDVGCRSRDSH